MQLANFHSDQNLRLRRSRGALAFTMIEIAISIGIIGFALVAIIGILPTGLNVQKDNREDTIVNQDANFFMQTIRRGADFSNNPAYDLVMPYAPGLNFLTNYVEAIGITNYAADGHLNASYYYTNTDTGKDKYFPLGGGILGLLSTPHFFVPNILDIYSPTGFSDTNYVRAWVRGINGSALEQNGQNSAVAFRYIMDVQISPFVSFPSNINILNTNDLWTSRLQKAQYMCHNLYEVELNFHWPVLANGAPGPNHQTFRSVIAGHMIQQAVPREAPYYVFQPQTFSTNTLQ